MTPRMPPLGPDRGRLGHDAARLLASRNVLDADPSDFARNRHFDRLHGGRFSDAEKPAVLFTACPHVLPVCGGSLPDKIVEWTGSHTRIKVDGENVTLLGFLENYSPLLVVEKHNRNERVRK